MSAAPPPSPETWRLTHPERPPGAPPPEPPTGEGEGRWRPWIAWVGLVAGFAGALFGGLIIAIIATAAGGDAEDMPPGALMAATVVQDISLVAAAILFARLTGPTAARHFGLRRPRFWQAVGWTVLVYVGFLVLAGLWATLVEQPSEQQVLEQLGVEDSDLALIGAAIMVCLLAPVVEEFFFRGFFFRALRNWRGFWPAAILTGLIFGGIHWEGSGAAGVIVPLMILGFGLCLLYERTGSLYPCIALHAINNAVAFGVSVDWTWQVPLLVLAALAACFAVTVGVSRVWTGRPPTPAPRPPAR